jgi:hypothetical protein
LLTGIGFETVMLKDRFDCFRGTSKENTAKKYGVLGVNVHAVRGCDDAAQS